MSKYIETGTAGQHQSGGPCCGGYCPLWEVGEERRKRGEREGGWGSKEGWMDVEMERGKKYNMKTDTDHQPFTCNAFMYFLLAAGTFKHRFQAC